MRYLVKFSLKSLLLVLIVCFLSPIIYASFPSLSITPSRFEVIVEPRGSYIGAIKISNMGTEPLMLGAKTLDWDMNDQEKLVLFDSGSQDKSASNWIRFNPKMFTVKPDSTQYIRFKVSPPPNATPGEYRTAFVIDTTATIKMNENSYYKPRFAILVYVNIPEINRGIKDSEITINTTEVGTSLAQGELVSTGNAHARVSGEYYLETADGEKIKWEQFTKKVILPERKTNFMIELGSLKPGNYKLKTVWNYIPAFYQEGDLSEYNGQEKVISEKEFVIK